MTLRHMRIFVTVCQCGSMTKAAEQLYLAQPAVSLAISELEHYYGVKLFDRINHRLYITDAGKRLLGAAMHITSLFDELETGMRNAELMGVLKVGSSITIGNHLLVHYIKEFSKEFPDTLVNATIDNSEVIEQKLLQNQLDFALIEGTVHSRFLESEIFARDELVLVCAPNHPFAKQKEVPLDALRKERFLLRENGSGARELFDSMLVAHRVYIMPAWQSISTHAILNGVTEGLGLSAVPSRIAEEYLKTGKIVRFFVKELDFSREYRIAYHKNKFFTAPALAFLELCRSSTPC